MKRGRKPSRCRVVEDHRRWQRRRASSCVLQPIPQLYSAERVDARLHEWCVRLHDTARSSTHNLKHCFQ